MEMDAGRKVIFKWSEGEVKYLWREADKKEYRHSNWLNGIH